MFQPVQGVEWTFKSWNFDIFNQFPAIILPSSTPHNPICMLSSDFVKKQNSKGWIIIQDWDYKKKQEGQGAATSSTIQKLLVIMNNKMMKIVFMVKAPAS